MSNAPAVYDLEKLAKVYSQEWPQACIDQKWYPARPLGYFSLVSRAKLAWEVFTGKADVLRWPGDQ